jgi:hypothetical protein
MNEPVRDGDLPHPRERLSCRKIANSLSEPLLAPNCPSFGVLDECQNVTDQEARKLVLTDPHSPGRWRVNGAVQNSAAFQEAFRCKQVQPMVAENACHVW